MNSQQRGTLAAIFSHPTPATIRWDHIVSLFRALGAEIREAEGSRVTFVLNGYRAVFHRPHPRPTTDRGAVKSIRRFLITAGVKPE